MSRESVPYLSFHAVSHEYLRMLLKFNNPGWQRDGYSEIFMQMKMTSLHSTFPHYQVLCYDHPKWILPLPAIQDLNLVVETVANPAAAYQGLQISCSGTDRRYL